MFRQETTTNFRCVSSFVITAWRVSSEPVPAVMKNAIDYLAKEWAGKPVSLVTFGGHGGSQAQVAMRMVVGGLKMKIMAVNLQISLSPNDSLAVADRRLHSYDGDAALLRAEFERQLK